MCFQFILMYETKYEFNSKLLELKGTVDPEIGSENLFITARAKHRRERHGEPIDRKTNNIILRLRKGVDSAGARKVGENKGSLDFILCKALFLILPYFLQHFPEVVLGARTGNQTSD